MFLYKKIKRIESKILGKIFKLKKIKNKKMYTHKQIALEYKKGSSEFIRFQEINLLVSINHPNLIFPRETLFDIYSNQIFLMSKCYTYDLKHISRFGIKFSIHQIKSILWQLSLGIKIMHENKTVHNDIKVDNILFSNKGIMKICDFGLAKQYIYTQTNKTKGVKHTFTLDLWTIGYIFIELLLKIVLFFPEKSKTGNLLGIFSLIEVSDLSCKSTKKSRAFRNTLNRKFKRRLSDFGLNLLSQFFVHNFLKKEIFIYTKGGSFNLDHE